MVSTYDQETLTLRLIHKHQVSQVSQASIEFVSGKTLLDTYESPPSDILKTLSFSAFHIDRAHLKGVHQGATLIPVTNCTLGLSDGSAVTRWMAGPIF